MLRAMASLQVNAENMINMDHLSGKNAESIKQGVGRQLQDAIWHALYGELIKEIYDLDKYLWRHIAHSECRDRMVRILDLLRLTDEPKEHAESQPKQS